MKSHWNGKSKGFHRFAENLWLQVWQFTDGFRLMSLGMCIWIKPRFVLPSREASAFLCFLCFQDIKAPVSKQKIQEANWMVMRYYQLLVINEPWTELNTVADLQQLPAWSESSFRCNMHKLGLRGLCWTMSKARIKPQTFCYEGLFPKRALAMHTAFLDPQLYLPLEISDFKTLSPEPRGAVFVIFSSLIYTSRGAKLKSEPGGDWGTWVLTCHMKLSCMSYTPQSI